MVAPLELFLSSAEVWQLRHVSQIGGEDRTKPCGSHTGWRARKTCMSTDPKGLGPEARVGGPETSQPDPVYRKWKVCGYVACGWSGDISTFLETVRTPEDQET